MPARRMVFMLVYSLLAAPLAWAASPAGLETRQSSDTRSLPEIQPLLKSLAKEFPKSAVNSFCSSVVPPSARPKTTVAATTQTQTIVETGTYAVEAFVGLLASDVP